MTDPAQGPTQILVVDDVDSNLLALEALLGSPSVSVVRARSGQEALNALRDKEFALVVLDVHMPEMDGFQTAAAIRQNESTRRLPIIFVTAHGTTKEKLAKAYELGVSEFLTKPIDTEALRAKVGVLMELARAINETRQNAETRTEQRLVEERQRWENEALRARVQEQQRATAAEHAARLEAETANRVKDEFLATLSHELRAPLNAIVGWASLMRARGPSEPSFSRGLDVIERNARAQTKLIDDMLDSSRIIAGKLRLDMAAVDLRQIIQRAVDAIRPDAERKRLVLTVELSPDLPIIPGDPERLHQVFANLLSNAVKFTRDDGEVSVEARRERSRVLIRVSDTGEGIAPDFLPHLFERFRQGEGGPTRSHAGLGIGLALARDLVALHGGQIDASSDGKGKGAVFTIRLPVSALTHPASHDQGWRATVAPGSLISVRVLVVDDEVDARDLLRELLEGAGATVLAVESAAAALDAVTSWRPDIVVSDIGMPAKDGCTLVQDIRALPDARARSVPAIALTAYTGVDDVARARRAGFQAHLAKPVDAADLLSAILAFVHPNPAAG